MKIIHVHFKIEVDEDNLNDVLESYRNTDGTLDKDTAIEDVMDGGKYAITLNFYGNMRKIAGDAELVDMTLYNDNREVITVS